MAINDRVKLLMEHEQLTSGEFADKTGIQQSTFSHFINGRNKASLDVVTKIHDAFSDISLDWLLYGRGSMRTQIPQGNGFTQANNGHHASEKNIDNSIASPVAGASYEALGAIAPILAKQAQLGNAVEPPKPQRKITEIRVFFDDNTYEIFKADK